MTLVLKLRQHPPHRLDLSAIVPLVMVGKSEREIAALPIGTTRERVTIGDMFALVHGRAGTIVFEGGSDRLDRIGADLTLGEIHVEGVVGMAAGRGMRSGLLAIAGDAGPYAGSGMTGGRLEIGGNVGERLGGPLAGEMAGMKGGLIVVRGNADARAGDRMRRGTIVVEGDAGDYAGARMIAGTLVVAGRTGALPGYLQRRGTLVLGAGAELPPGFLDCGPGDLVFQHLFAQMLWHDSARAAALLRGRLRRFAGDQAVLGKGEIFLAE